MRPALAVASITPESRSIRASAFQSCMCICHDKTSWTCICATDRWTAVAGSRFLRGQRGAAAGSHPSRLDLLAAGPDQRWAAVATAGLLRSPLALPGLLCSPLLPGLCAPHRRFAGVCRGRRSRSLVPGMTFQLMLFPYCYIIYHEISVFLLPSYFIIAIMVLLCWESTRSSSSLHPGHALSNQW